MEKSMETGMDHVMMLVITVYRLEGLGQDT